MDAITRSDPSSNTVLWRIELKSPSGLPMPALEIRTPCERSALAEAMRIKPECEVLSISRRPTSQGSR